MGNIDLIRLWEERTKHEFSTRDTETTLATMVEDAYVNHVPVLTGGYGKTALRAFYSRDFISKRPPDTALTPISRTVGEDQIVDEMIFSFTHARDALDAAWCSTNRPPRRDSFGCHRPLSRRQICARAHLLGPGFRAQINRTTGRS